MSTKLTKVFRLKNLTYYDVVEKLNHVCFGVFHLPNNDDTCTAVNNEFSFDRWKQRLMCRYPLATVTFNASSSWSEKVLIHDPKFEYDREMFQAVKVEFLKSERGYV